MAAIPLMPPLLVDNDRLRDLMREREQLPANAVAATRVTALLKPAALRQFGSLLFLSCKNVAQREWPDALRQLHWELCASTQLRPMAKAMNKAALLPDTFVEQGGLWGGAHVLQAAAPRHPRTQLFTVLRLDVLLQGAAELLVNGAVNIALAAGDALLSDAADAVAFADTANIQVWTVFYYSPDACCCGRSGSEKSAGDTPVQEQHL